MHLLSLSLLALAFVSGQQTEKAARCAYLGQWGSFHLIGNGGSAAYALGGQRYIADLQRSQQDDLHWYYTPSGGDPWTTGWAFSRTTDSCGKYWVWRFDGNRWHPYEATRGWGDGLTRGFTAQATRSDANKFIIIEQTLKKHDERIKALEQKPN